jgi:hypothetical protein
MKERARRIGGELIIETEPGEGTRVEFDINCANPNVQADLEPFKYTRTLPETIISGKITTR